MVLRVHDIFTYVQELLIKFWWGPDNFQHYIHIISLSVVSAILIRGLKYAFILASIPRILGKELCIEISSWYPISSILLYKLPWGLLAWRLSDRDIISCTTMIALSVWEWAHWYVQSLLRLSNSDQKLPFAILIIVFLGSWHNDVFGKEMANVFRYGGNILYLRVQMCS